MKATRLLLGLAAAVTALTSGCASRVQAWERGTLASYEMRADRDPIASQASEHIYFSREGASGGRRVGGGGCGCN